MQGSLVAIRRQHVPCWGAVVRRVASWTAVLVSSSTLGASAAGFAPSETIFPATTRVWVSITDPRGLRERFDRTDVGRLVKDPQMLPFVESVREQAKKAGTRRLGRLGLSYEDFADLPGGEVALGVVEPAPGRLASVLLVDTTGHADEARRLVDTIGTRLAERKGTRTTATSGGDATMTVYSVPPEPGSEHATTVAIVLGTDALVVGDDPAVVMQTASSLGTGRADSLSTTESWKAVAERCGTRVSAGAAPIRWHVDPLGFARAFQAANPPREKRKGPDYVAILGRQGFDAVKAVGGVVVFAEGPHDVRHHTLIHAPPIEGRKAFSPDRFRLAARMLHFPNAESLEPHAWVPRDVSGWMTMQWDMQNAFASVESLVDDVVGEKGVFEDVIASLKEDPDGPQIDVEKDLVGCLGTRVSIVSDHTTPIDVDSERLVIAIEARDPERVARTVAKSMATDPDMRRVEFNGHEIWELVDRSDSIPKLEIETPGLALPGPAAEAEDDQDAKARRARIRDREEKLLPHSAVTVAHGHLLVASHRDFLERVLTTSAGEGTLGVADDYGVVSEELVRLFPSGTALRSFSRSDESIRPAYEMLRRGEMPKSKSLMGQLLNALLGDGKEGSVREQRIDGSTLPEFGVVERYFGAGGVAMESVSEGWEIGGVALPREARATSLAREPSGSVGR